MEAGSAAGVASDRVAADPLDAVGISAQELGARFVARRRLRAWLTVLAGVVVAFGGFAGFGYFGGEQDTLIHDGTHTVATVTSAALYGGRFGPNRFTAHIDVQFAYPGGEARAVRIYIGERDRFTVGQQVEVVYDRRDPHHAVLADGRHDIGPVGFPLFFAIVLGLCLVVVGVRDARLFHGARRALREGARTMEADSQLVATGRVRRQLLSLRSEDGEPAALLWSATKRGWTSPLRPVEATVYGSMEPGSVVVVVDAPRQAVTAGRVWGPSRVARHLRRR